MGNVDRLDSFRAAITSLDRLSISVAQKTNMFVSNRYRMSLYSMNLGSYTMNEP